jgi:hypothetical protein
MNTKKVFFTNSPIFEKVIKNVIKSGKEEEKKNYSTLYRQKDTVRTFNYYPQPDPDGL